MQAKMEELGLLDPKKGFPQTNAEDLMAYREVFDVDLLENGVRRFQPGGKPRVTHFIAAEIEPPVTP